MIIWHLLDKTKKASLAKGVVSECYINLLLASSSDHYAGPFILPLPGSLVLLCCANSPDSVWRL